MGFAQLPPKIFWIGVAAGRLVPWFVKRILKHFVSRQKLTYRLEDCEVNPPVQRQVPLYEHMESVQWLNRILAHIFYRQGPFLSTLIMMKLQPLITAAAPTFLPELFIERLSLGRQAPYFHNVKTFRTKKEFFVTTLDTDLDWNTSDTEFVLATKWLGVSAPLIRVHKLNISCKIRVSIELDPLILAVRKLKIALLERPKLRLAIEPLSTSIDICSVPALSNWLYSFLSITLTKDMLWPNGIQIDLSADMVAQATGEANPAAVAGSYAHDNDMLKGTGSSLESLGGKQCLGEDMHGNRTSFSSTSSVVSGSSSFSHPPPNAFPEKTYSNPIYIFFLNTLLQDTLSSIRSCVAAPGKLMRSYVINVEPNRQLRIPLNTRGVLHARIVEAVRLNDRDSVVDDKEVLAHAHLPLDFGSLMNTSATLSLNGHVVSTRTIKRNSNPFYDELFELHVHDEDHDLLLIQIILHNDVTLLKGSILGSAWIGVGEIAKFNDWIDIWLPLCQLSAKSIGGSARSRNRGNIRLQLFYERFLDMNQKAPIPLPLEASNNTDTTASTRDRRAAVPSVDLSSTSSAVSKDMKQETNNGMVELSTQSAVRGSPGTGFAAGSEELKVSVLGWWQVHLLEGAQFKRRDNGRPVMDARVDFQCGGKTFRSNPSLDTETHIFGQYFEIPVRDSLVETVLHVVGFDENPFVKDAQVGDGMFMLKGFGDVQPTDIWIRLKRKKKVAPQESTSSSSWSQMETAGWVRVWISFKALLQENQSEWLTSTSEIVLNPTRSDLRTRAAQIAERQQALKAASQRNIAALQSPQQQIQLQTQTFKKEGALIGQSFLMDSMNQLNSQYLFGLIQRLPRSLAGFSTHLVYNDVIGQLLGRTAEEPQAERKSNRNATVGSVSDDQEEVETSEDEFEAMYGAVEERTDRIPMFSIQVDVYTGDASTKKEVYVEFLSDWNDWNPRPAEQGTDSPRSSPSSPHVGDGSPSGNQKDGARTSSSNHTSLSAKKSFRRMKGSPENDSSAQFPGYSDLKLLHRDSLTSFRRGAVDTFLVRSILSAERIQSIRVVHLGPSWFLQKICISNATDSIDGVAVISSGSASLSASQTKGKATSTSSTSSSAISKPFYTFECQAFLGTSSGVTEMVLHRSL